MSYSAQTDRFVHDRLPPPEQCAQMRYELPELRIPDQANLVASGSPETPDEARQS